MAPPVDDLKKTARLQMVMKLNVLLFLVQRMSSHKEFSESDDVVSVSLVAVLFVCACQWILERLSIR